MRILNHAFHYQSAKKYFERSWKSGPGRTSVIVMRISLGKIFPAYSSLEMRVSLHTHH